MAQIVVCQGKYFGTCRIDGETIENKELEFVFPPHDLLVTDFDINNCSILEFPLAAPIIQHIPHLTTLSLISTNIQVIKKEDLNGFGCLRELEIIDSLLEYLPEDLFHYTPNLENICFEGNKIKFIDVKIFDNLDALNHVDLSNNININAAYDEEEENFDNDFVTWDELMQIITRDCQRPKGLVVTEENAKEIEQLKQVCADQQIKIDEQERKINEQERKIDDQEGRIDRLIDAMEEMALNYEALKREVKNMARKGDFVLIVNGKEFDVQKAKFASHSQVFKELIEENPDAERLKLDDVSEEVIEEIVNYIESGNPPKSHENLINLYAASSRLKMNGYTEMIIDILRHKITPQNALNVLIVSNQYNNEELKMKAYLEFMKNFPEQQLQPQLASQPEVLKKMLQTTKRA